MLVAFREFQLTPLARMPRCPPTKLLRPEIVNRQKSLTLINELPVSKEGDQSDYLFEVSLKAFVHWCIGISMDNNRTVK